MTSSIDRDSWSIVVSFLEGTEKHDKLVAEFKEKKHNYIVECNNCQRVTTSYDFCGVCYNRLCSECGKTELDRICCDDKDGYCFKRYEHTHL